MTLNGNIPAGTGSSGLHLGNTTTVLTPATTNNNTAKVKSDSPLRFERGGTQGLTRVAALCADGAIPEMIAIHDMDMPNWPVGVRMVPNPVAGSAPSGQFFAWIPKDPAHTPAASDDLQVAAGAALGTWKTVAAGAGVGRVVEVVGDLIHVEF